MRVGTARAMIEVMRTKRVLRSSWVVTVGASAALVGACGGSTANGNGLDGGGSGDSGNPTDCPTAAPQVGSACSVQNGEACNYGSQCSPSTYECNGGTWTAFHGNPPAPTCPATPPSGACSCYPANFQCMYTSGTCLGMPTQEIVSCSNGQWIFSVSTCNPPAVDSGAETGVGDAGTADATLD